MSNNIKTNLAGRINQYVQYRRQVKKTSDGSFAEALSNKAEEKSRTDAKAVENVQYNASKKERGSRGRKVRTHMVASSGARKIYPKHITRVQASRLASYAGVIAQASKRYKVPVELVCAVILQESGGNSKAVSHCGARGLMQLMPATAKRLGVSNSFDATQNIMGGTKYLRMLLDRFDGNVALALAGYNSGEGNVEKYGRKIPPFKETRAYVPSVLKYADTLWNILRQPAQRVVARPPASAPIRHSTIF